MPKYWKVDTGVTYFDIFFEILPSFRIIISSQSGSK